MTKLTVRSAPFAPSLLILAMAAQVACDAGSDDDGMGGGAGGTTTGTGGTTGVTGGAPGTGGDTATGGAATGGTTAGTGGAGTGGGNGRFECPASPGTAPSGDMMADPIMATFPTDYDFHLMEGPVWIDGALYYSDFTTQEGFPSQIKKYTPGGSAEVFIPDAGSSDTTSGSNGLAVNADGDIVAATHDQKEISIYDIETKNRTSVVGMYMGAEFNSPNDLVVGPDGDIYFTDPNFQKGSGTGQGSATRVYHWNGTEVSVVDDSISNPNGITLSPDGSVLYVAGGGNNGTLRSYPLTDGVPGTGMDLVEMLAEPDGMTVDCLGNIYATEHSNSRVRVFDSTGMEIAKINLGTVEVNGTQDSNATNVAFGGADRKTLYITGTYSVWEIDLDVTGFPY